LVLNFFRKCGISVIVFSSILVISLTVGCINSSISLKEQQDPAESALDAQLKENDALELSFQPEVSGSLFSTRGSVLLRHGGGLPYLMLNATLMQGSVPIDYVSYMMIDVEPGRSRSFEISLNKKIDLELNYTCHLDVSGSDGVLASESRECSMTAGAKGEDPNVAVLSHEELRKLELEYIKFGQSLAEASEEESSSGSKKESDSFKSKSESSNLDETASEALEDEESSDGGSSNLSSQPDVALAVIEEASEAEDNGSEDGQFVASTSSKKYHSLDCRYATKMKEENRIYFQSAEEAEDQGYEPCKVCSPG
jgi:hypothetical protein